MHKKWPNRTPRSDAREASQFFSPSQSRAGGPDVGRHMSEVTVASTSELPEVAAFYATCGYGGGISQADTVLVSRICGQLVGVVRLCPQEGVVVLRGMQVHPAFWRQGVG